MKKCSVSGCKNIHHAKGLCSIHYARVVRFGSTDLPTKQPKTMGICINEGCERAAEEGTQCKNCIRLARRRENKKVKLIRRKPANVCSVFGCNNKKYMKGMCTKHYLRNKKTGDVFSEEFVICDFTVKEKLLFNVKLDKETRCWEWLGRKDKDGYGIMSVGDYPTRVHRIMYEQIKGDIKEDFLVCHKCDNPGCINPAHLFLGTIQDNNNDRDTKGRTPKGEDSMSSVLTENDVLEIRELLKTGMTNKQIGEKYGVTGWAISRIKCGKTWKHLE